MDSETLHQLRRITKHSSRVAEARKKFGLKKGEYIGLFRKGGRTKTTTGRVAPHNKKFYDGIIRDYVRSEIVDYFELPLPIETVMDAIFRTLPLPDTYHVSSWVENDGIARVTINLYELPKTAVQMEGIFDDFKGHIEKLHFLKKNFLAKGMKATVIPFKKMDDVRFFDEKYYVARRYAKLRAKYKPKKIPALELKQLREEADKLLPESRIKSTQVLIGVVDEFEKKYYLK